MNELLAVHGSKKGIDMVLSNGNRKIMRTIMTEDIPLPLVGSKAELPSETNATHGNHETFKLHVPHQPIDEDENEEDDEEEEVVEEKPKKRRTWKKPKDKPKRPLSAYNLFFQHEREKLITNNSGDEEDCATEKTFPIQLTKKSKQTSKRRHRKSHGKIGFADLARTISSKWKEIDPETKQRFEREADREKQRYKIALIKWRENSKLIASGKIAKDDVASVHSDCKEEEDSGVLSPARRISLDYSTASNSTAAAAAAAAARSEAPDNMQRGSMAALMAALQHHPMNATSQTHHLHHQPSVEFFPRLMPNVGRFASMYNNGPMPGHPLNHLFAAAAGAAAHQSAVAHQSAAAQLAAHQSAAAAAAANQSAMAAAIANRTAVQGRLEGLAQANPLHDLAWYSDLFGRNQLVYGMATPVDDAAAFRNFLNHLQGNRGDGM